MCDGCVDMLQLLESGDHHELSKLEVSIFVTFMCNWQNRQCSCCFKDYKNFEICNNLLQKVMALAIRFINTLPEDCEREMQASGWGRARSDSERDAESAQVTEKSEKADEGKTEGAPAKDTAGDAQLGENAEESWSLQEKERLLACMVRAFTTAFPHYIAYKHMVHGTLEDLPQQETSALSNYCDTTDVELPLYLLRNVCFLIDSNGITALKNCFEKASPDNLPFGLAQILINLVANVRNWMNAHAIVQYIVPLRSILIGYMCRLSDKELKMAGNRNVIEIMCQAVKDPNEAGYMTDHMGLELHFKLFTCSTLVNRLAGLQQMTTQVTRITDSMNNDSLLEPEGMFGDGNQRRRAIAASQHRKSACARMGAELAKWMVDREIIEHIFGPNLHVEIVKQSQAVINFVADEGKMTTKHIGAMWAAAQLKHCSKQVYDVLITLVPHLSAENVNHLDALLKDLPTANLTDSVLILSSSLMKQQWMVNPLHSQSAAAIQQQPHLGMTLSALRQDEEDMDTDVTKAGQDLSSSESMQDSEEGDSQKHRQMEPGEIRHRLTGMGRGACLHDDKADSGESESSLEGQSEFSNASEDSDGGLDVEGEGRTPVVGARGPAMGKRQLPAARLASEDSDDGTDSDEDLGSGKLAGELQREKRPSKKRPFASTGPQGSRAPGPDELKKVKVYCLDKEDEDLVREAKLVHKQYCGEKDSSDEEESDFEFIPPAPLKVKIEPNKGKKRPDKRKLEDLAESCDPGMASSDMASRQEVHCLDKEDEELVKQAMQVHLQYCCKEKEDNNNNNDDIENSGSSQPAKVAVDVGGEQSCHMRRKRGGPPQSLHREESDRKALHSVRVHCIDKEDEDLVKEAKMVHMQYCPGARDSDDENISESYTASTESLEAAEEVGEGPSSRKKRREDAGVAHQPITVPPKLAAVRKTSGAQEGSELGVAVGEHGAKAAGPVDAPKAGGDAQVYDFSSGMPHIRHHGPAFAGADFGENILSPDEGSCHSSQLSTKSEKNMADFDGEDGLSEEELTQINSHATFSAHQLPQHLAAAFHSQAHVPQSVIHHRPTRAEAVLAADGAFEDVCKEGKTMLWDIIQDDKIGQLPEGLAVEVEKILSNLLSYINDKRINLKFIEACITNLANHRSVVVSLRLITKIFSAFSRQSPPMDTHTYVMWAVKKHDMMTHFFNDLIHYAKNGSQTLSLHPHKEQVQVRLNFLTFVYSAKGSPDSLRMDLNQVDILWRYLALDPECSDDCLNWFLIQAKVKEHHGLSLDTFRHIFLEKMPSLKPENISMTGLSLFQQLSQLARIPGAPYETALTENELSGMNQLWEIALLASDKDVSSNASTYLCNYYIGYGNGTLEKEEEFVQRCMASLVKATEHMKDDVRHNLLITQRGLALLKNQLDIFRQKYAYHLRNWQIENRGILSHNQLRSPGKNASSIQLLLQAACINEKTPLEMFGTDLIAELRAEVTRYWENLQHEQRLLQQQGQPSPNTQGMAPILGAMLGDGPIRMISHGQELGFDMDEKSLADFGFKDGMIVFVSVGSIRQPRKADGTTPSSCLPPPPRDRMPMNLLLQTPHFDNLFTLLEQLSNLEVDTTLDDHQGLLADARRQSRNVWDLLMALPTSPTHLTGLNNIVSNEAAVVDWESLLPPQSPHRLYYSLQIVESLSHQAHSSKQSLMTVGGGDGQEVEIRQDTQENAWTTNFIAKQGLTHLFSIFLSGSLQPRQGDTWSQWNQECLAYLLRLISQFSILDADAEPIYDELFGESFHSPRKFRRKPKPTTERILIPRLKQSVINVLRPEAVVQILMKILFEAVLPEDTNQLYIASWGRAEVVHYALHFFLTLAFSFTEVKDLLCSAPNFTVWLKRLTMEAPEPPVRREACSGLYRLCLGQTADGRSGLCFLLPVLKSMLFFLPTAFNFKPQKNNEMESPKEKEPFGSGCRDFFWLLCRLMESLPRGDEMAAEDNDLDLDRLLTEVVSYIEEREIYETRLGCEEDDVLIGLLNLVTAILKNNPPFKESEEAKDLMDKAVTYLFDLPSPDNRILPKCKSQHAQEAAYDILVELMKGSLRNYDHGHTFFMGQHSKDAHEPYPWDYWPHDDGRSKCGYVGLTNLGATCYMATCVQHLYMIPEMREAILQAKLDEIERHAEIMSELQKMFAYLQESERKAYNPKMFCKVYTMDHQPLNTGEQKDMTEFLTDLITKMEEMSPKVKRVVRNLFGGVMTNSVVSLDCPHVSVGFDYFYTVRCQVCDMKDLFDSLDEVCVKDTLEGDNKYTCDECHNKVRAVKGSCFRRLPEFFLLNTMRYTFNMVTMLKEKVNTHFSFPLSMDVSRYMEKNVLGPEKRKDIRAAALKKGGSDNTPGDDDSTSYELIGVTVHTGTAEGGHYYSFSQDLLSQSENSQAKWYLFNDAEVKLFDPVQLPAECFGGEMVSKQYDSVGEKFVDMSFEKTNSAYMLLYARVPSSREPKRQYNFELQEHLSSWIWRDNRQFLQDKNIFEHHYFNFIWQMCYYLPTTLPRPPDNSVTLKAAQLGTCFLLETYIHSKEKPNTLQWVETLTKLFNSCHEACEWFLDLMAQSDWWPVQILIKCPNQTVRQMFQRLIIHVIKQLRESHVSQYLVGDENAREGEPDYLGCQSCVTRFIRKMLSIVEHGVKPQSKYLSEYFGLLLEFAKMGVEESSFLTKAGAIGQMIHFYMGPRNSESSSNNTITDNQKMQQKENEQVDKGEKEKVEIVSDEEEDDDVITLSDDNMRPTSLEKMVGLISMLVERSRDDRDLNLSEKDFNAIMGGKGFPFLFNQVRDNINIQQTRNLIFSMTRWNNAAAQQVVAMIFNAIRKLSNELANNFFKLMSLLVENTAGPPGQPDYTNLILDRIWDLCRYCPTQVLEWLTGRVTNHKYIHNWVLSQLDVLVEPYLIAHNVVRVRNSAAYLLVSLVPNCSFRNSFRPPRGMLQQTKDLTINMDATEIVHQIYRHLLGLLGKAKQYVADNTLHGTTKLMCYFAVMTYCLVGKPEKLMFREYFMDLWNLFHPRLSEPQISMFHNKQALLMFWHEVCKDCPENVKLITSNPAVCRNIAFNYILADHEDQDVVIFNRMMLPNYYGLLRMCCQQSRQFTRQLACHQNIQWAFKNITPHQTQYNLAVEELMKMMKLMATRHPDATEDELKQVAAFRKSTIHMYLTSLEPRSSWQTLISALKILVETKEERLLIVYQHGLSALSEAFFTLFSMYHEATACHVVTDIIDLLTLLNQIFDTCRDCNDKKSPTSTDIKLCLNNWKDKQELVKKVVSMLNSFTPPDLRNICIDLLKQMVLTMQSEVIAIIVPLLLQAHVNFQDSNMPDWRRQRRTEEQRRRQRLKAEEVTSGPYFPRRGQKEMTPKTNIRPRPQFQMLLNNSQLEVPRNVDEAYDQALSEYFVPYHLLVDVMCRVAVNMQNMSSNLITLSAMVAYEGIPLHLPYFAKLWCEIYNSPPVDRSYIKLLCNSGSFIDYVDAVLLDERQSLNNNIIYQFFLIFFPKVYQQVINETGRHLLDNLIISMAAEKSTLEGLVAEVPGPKHEKELARICSRILGDMRALMLVVNQQRFVANTVLLESLQGILQACRMYQLPEDSPSPPPTPAPTEAEPSAEAEVEAEERQLEKEPPAAMEAKAGTSKALEASQEEPMETEAVEEGSKENVSPSEDSTDKPSASAAAERAGMKRKDPAVAGTSKDGGSSLLPMDPAACQKAARDSVSSDSTKPDQSEPRPGTSHSEEPGTSQSGACAEPGTSQSGLGGRGVDALFLGPRRPRLMEMVIKLCESLLTMFQSTSIPASPSP